MDDFPLGDYIATLLEQRHLSMREASMRADLAPETISQLLRRGPSSKPRPETLLMIAEALDGDYVHMLRLAGHLPEVDAEPTPTAVRLRAEELIAKWREIYEVDPQAAENLMRLTVVQAEAFQVAVSTRRHAEEGEQEDTHHSLAH
jgi:transcriptional regulator with XRE-family HTH domain